MQMKNNGNNTKNVKLVKTNRHGTTNSINELTHDMNNSHIGPTGIKGNSKTTRRNVNVNNN